MYNPRGINWTRLVDDVVLRKAAVVASVQHTGTWFAIDLLRSHPAMTPEPVFDLVELLGRPVTPNSILYSHVNFIEDEGLATLARSGRTLSPLRDPLLAILSRNARHPSLDHRYIVDGFLRLAALEPGPIYLRVDCRPEEREGQVQAALSGLGLEPDPGFVSFFARAWTARNVSGDTAPKELYRNGNFDGLRRFVGPEIDYLLEARDRLVPFLGSVGYTGLPWWSL